MATTTEERIHIITSFQTGMQRRTTKFLNQATDVLLAKNVDFQYRLGGISKALGYAKKGGSISGNLPILGAGSLNTSAGTNKLIAFAGTDAYIWDGGSNWTAQSRAYTASQKFETERFLDQLFVVNGITDAPENFNGSAWSTTTNVADMPKGKFIVEDKLRLYVFNVSIPQGGNYPSRFFYCDLPKNNVIQWGIETGADLASSATTAVVTSAGSLFVTRGIKVGDPFFIVSGNNAGEYEVKTIDSETQITLTTNVTNTTSNQSFWVGGNWEDVARDNSDVGMGIGKNADRVLFFKRFSVHKWSKGVTDSDNTLIPVKGVPGTVSHRSIVNVRDFTLYWADSGLWQYDGNSAQLVSNPLQEVVEGIPAANLSTICGWSVNDRIVKMFVGNVNNADTGLVINNCVVCYDVFSDAWWVEEYDDTINCSTRWVESSALKNFIFSNDGEIFQSESGNAYNGNAFPMEVETWFYWPIAPEVAVNFTRFKTYTQHGRGIQCEYKLAYFSAEGGYRVDSEWRRLKPKYKTEDEQEWTMDEESNRASGYALKFYESSNTNARPVIERIAAFYTGGEVR
jgi:hypothetical protein